MVSSLLLPPCIPNPTPMMTMSFGVDSFGSTYLYSSTFSERPIHSTTVTVWKIYLLFSRHRDMLETHVRHGLLEEFGVQDLHRSAVIVRMEIFVLHIL